VEHLIQRLISLPGGTFTGDIDDVKYLRDKMFAAIKIPQSYLSRGEGGEEDKTTLAQKDIRFARTIQRLQKSVISELEKIGIIHLYTLGYKGDDLLGHKLYLNNPSRIAELQELEYWKTKFDVASSATENFFSKQWIAKNLFGLSDEEFIKNQRELFYDKKFANTLEVVGSEEEAGGGGAIGGSLFGGEQEGGTQETPTEPTLPGEEEGEIEGEETPQLDSQGEPQDKMLIPPAKREDQLTTTPRSKGKMYRPAKYRGGDHRQSGARLRSYMAHGGQQVGSGTKRNVLGTGALELFSLGNGVYESKNKDEDQIIQTDNDIKVLIENLSTKERQKDKKDDEA
jgi:hypothetical protein